jgi:hypothetical protein
MIFSQTHFTGVGLRAGIEDTVEVAIDFSAAG